MINEEISRTYDKAGFGNLEIIPKEVVEAEEKLTIQKLVKEREEIHRRRELEEKKQTHLKIKDKKFAKTAEYSVYLRR